MAPDFPSRNVIKHQLFRLLTKRGSVSIAQAYAALAESLALSPEQLALKRAGDLLYRHEIRFARLELEQEGALKNFRESGRGTWELASGIPKEPPVMPVEEGQNFLEGAVHQVFISRYERSADARKGCLAYHGTKCIVCDFDFAREFGALGEGVIHVHHLLGLSEISESYVVDPVTDLVPLCPNCHQMAHRRQPAFSLAELKKMRTTAAVALIHSQRRDAGVDL